MLSFTHFQRQLSAFGLLVLFVSALGLATACAVWCGPLHGTRAAFQRLTGTAPKAAHSCCAKAAARKAAETPSKGAKSTDCCAHDKAEKWAFSPNQEVQKLLKQGPPLLHLPPVDGWLSGLRTAQRWDRSLAVRLVPAQHLPPKIPDVRIFLHSLTI